MALTLEDYEKYVQWGTSTWTYEGWKEIVYFKEYNKQSFKKDCLAEYARDERFSTVGMDLFFYRPPATKTLAYYADQLPQGFECCSKIWEEITIKKYPNHPRYRDKKGTDNPNFLNADKFFSEVLEPYEIAFEDHTGPFIFEFSYMSKEVMASVDQFSEQLDRFFSELPRDFQYSVEIRNRNFLAPVYFDALRKHNVSHCFNWWSYMPPISYQLKYDSITANFIVSRVLTPLGIPYNKAVEKFQPYNKVLEPQPRMREDVSRLASLALELQTPAYILINNRAEGCAPLTIDNLNKLIREYIQEQDRAKTL